MKTYYYKTHGNWYYTQCHEFEVLRTDVDAAIKVTPNGNGIFYYGTRQELEDELKLRKYIPIDVVAKEEMLLIALRAEFKPYPHKTSPRPKRYPAY